MEAPAAGAVPPEVEVELARISYLEVRDREDRSLVTAIELGDGDRGYTAIDITRKNEGLYSLTCSLYVGMFLMSIPKLSKGQLPVVPKNKEGRPLTSKVEALDRPRVSTPDLLPPSGAVVTGDFWIYAG